MKEQIQLSKETRKYLSRLIFNDFHALDINDISQLDKPKAILKASRELGLKNIIEEIGLSSEEKKIRDDYWTIQEVADQLGITVKTAKKKEEMDYFRSHDVAGKELYLKKEIKALPKPKKNNTAPQVIYPVR